MIIEIITVTTAAVPAAASKQQQYADNNNKNYDENILKFMFVLRNDVKEGRKTERKLVGGGCCKDGGGLANEK